MAENYTSVAEHLNDIIDCRSLTLAFEFYDFCSEDVVSLLHEIIQWTEQLFEGSFISEQFINNKHIPKTKVFLAAQALMTDYQCFSYGQNSFAMSSAVYNKKTLSTHLKKMRTRSYLSSPDFSVDYPTYWENLFSSTDNTSFSIKDNILHLFNEKEKIPLSVYLLPDVQIIYSATAYAKQRTQFYGNFSMHFSAFCLNGQLEAVSELFTRFAVCISSQYVNINARIQLQPVHGVDLGPHMHYFGSYARTDGSHIRAICTESEWYQTYYLPGSEWFNVISPRARIHLNDSILNTKAGYSTEEISGGGLIVRSKKSIDKYDIDDALCIKKCLYPALYPGRSAISLKQLLSVGSYKFNFGVFPRQQWEIIPMLCDEIDIVGNSLVFSHGG